MAAERIVLKKGQPYYEGGTVPKRAREDIVFTDSEMSAALSTPVDPVASAEAKRRIAFLTQLPRTGGVTGYLDA
ncbi:MAG: hypothetical protein HY381_02525 [Candidatus Chisholmbacteria bacterium]|nr:hypothetical protein [Candidatus Chisholmbacteria bacterium]